MPLEIKELHIRVTVNQPQAGAEAPAAGNGGGKNDDKELLIQQCVEQVMDMIHNKNER